MGNKERKYRTKARTHYLKKLYQALMKEGDIPSDIISRCVDGGLDHGKDLFVMIGMHAEREEGGVPALEAYVASLSESEDPYDKWVIKILLKPESENDTGTLLSDVQSQKTPWLWYPRLALGKITMLDGDPGLGKSLIGADIGARVTTGGKMPDGTPGLATGGVVVIMPEDSLQDTILPRFARAGADLSKVVDLSTVQADEDEDVDEGEDEDVGEDEDRESRRPFRLDSDLDFLEAAIRRVKAKLVFIDPVMALAGSTNMYNDDDVRTLLLPLKVLVEKLQVACVMVRHMTKTRSENPLMAGHGSIAFIGLARTGLMVVQHPEDKSQVILSHIKSNIGPLAPGITYTICSDEAAGDDRPYVVWGNEIQASASDLIAAPRKTARK